MTVKFPTMHPVYGLPLNFNVSDLPPSGARTPVEFLSAVTQDTLSEAKEMGARAVQLAMLSIPCAAVTGEPVHGGPGLNDLTAGGIYTGAADAVYVVKLGPTAGFGNVAFLGTGENDLAKSGTFTGVEDTSYSVSIVGEGGVRPAVFTGSGPNDLTPSGTFDGEDGDYHVTISAEAAIDTAVHTGMGVDDLAASGVFTGMANATYTVKLSAVGAIAPVSFAGTGRNDATSLGTFAGTADETFLVKISKEAEVGSAVITGTGVDDLTASGTFIGPADATYTIKLSEAGAIAPAAFDGVGQDDATSLGTYAGTAEETFTVKVSKEAAVGAAVLTGTGVDDLTSSGTFVGLAEAAYTIKLSTVAAIGSATFVGAGLDDATSSGTFSGELDETVSVKISTADTVDKFQWKLDAGEWSLEIEITGVAQELVDGVSITFTAVTGHTEGDVWTVACTVDRCRWKKDLGEYSAEIPLMGEAQDIGIEGVQVTFATVTDHTLNDTWAIACTVDCVQWKKGIGDYSSDVPIILAPMDLEDGAQMQFTLVTGHTLNDVWTVDCTVDSFQWKKDLGEYGAEIPLTGEVQDIGAEGVQVTFAAATGHTLDDTWSIPCTVDCFQWKKGTGDYSVDVSITLAAQDLAEGVQILFLWTSGHILDDAWTVDCTVDRFQWKKGEGDQYSDDVVLTTAVQAIGDEGVEITFATVAGHTLDDTWAIACTVDQFTWSTGGPESPPLALTVALQLIGTEGLEVTFASACGHTLADAWTIPCYLTDKFRWKRASGAWNDADLAITGAAQPLGAEGLSVTFDSTLGHGLGATWLIPAAVDRCSWKKDLGEYSPAVILVAGGEGQAVAGGLTVTFAANRGHTLNDTWTIACTAAIPHPQVSCDLELYTSGDAGDVLVKSWEGVNVTNRDGLYAGNLEHVDLQGLPLKIKAKNISGGAVTVRAVMVV